MRPSDVKNLLRFHTRHGMFIWPFTREAMVSFVHGYEYGTEGECRFTKLLGEHIARRYGVKLDAQGWPGQIEQLAGQRSLHWLDIYLIVSAEVLGEAMRSETLQGPVQEAEAEPDRWAQVTVEARFESLTDLWAKQEGLRSTDVVRTILVPETVINAGAMLPSLPTSMIERLGLTRSSTNRIRSNGAVEVPMYEAVRLTIMGRQCTTDVLEVPESRPATIGRIAMQCLDLVVDPQTQTLIGNPAHGGEQLLEM